MRRITAWRNFSANSQNVASTNLLTSGGLDAGTVEKENAFYGYQAGRFTENAYNSFFGHLAGAKNVSGDSNSFLDIRPESIMEKAVQILLLVQVPDHIIMTEDITFMWVMPAAHQIKEIQTLSLEPIPVQKLQEKAMS
ncbi:hypothetical protein H9W95_04860 [Flavobacterium lindanitolerans]|nr:hypothetical protein [Flavobacterium lindanitolerans]